MKYSKKQILEAISYWQKELKKQLDESGPEGRTPEKDCIFGPDEVGEQIVERLRQTNMFTRVEFDNDINNNMFDVYANFYVDQLPGGKEPIPFEQASKFCEIVKDIPSMSNNLDFYKIEISDDQIIAYFIIHE